jgi:hypothetical protein
VYSYEISTGRKKELRAAVRESSGLLCWDRNGTRGLGLDDDDCDLFFNQEGFPTLTHFSLFIGMKQQMHSRNPCVCSCQKHLTQHSDLYALWYDWHVELNSTSTQCTGHKTQYRTLYTKSHHTYRFYRINPNFTLF